MDVKLLQDIPPWEWPEDAGTTFLALLRDVQAEASDRLLAAELAGDFTVINDEIAEALLAVVRNSDESDALRSTAALSFGAALEHVDTMGFDDDEEPVLSPETFHNVQHTLRDLFFDATVPEAVRRHILEVSVRAPEDWHEDAVRAAYVSDDEAWRLTAVFCMRFIDGFEELILEALNSGQADMRYQAVCAAGNWGLDAAWSHVVPLAQGPFGPSRGSPRPLPCWVAGRRRDEERDYGTGGGRHPRVEPRCRRGVGQRWQGLHARLSPVHPGQAVGCGLLRRRRQRTAIHETRRRVQGMGKRPLPSRR